MRRWFLLGWIGLLACGCGRYVERERETGHRGDARLNPFLAAERFLEGLGYPVASVRRWPVPDEGDAMLVVPAAMLGAEGQVRQVAAWVEGGGHLVCLFAHADASAGDWRLDNASSSAEVPGVLSAWLGECGVEVRAPGIAGTGRRVVEAGGRAFEVSRAGMRRFTRRAVPGGEAVPVRSVLSLERGAGRVTLVSDARVFRNRFLGEADNGRLLAWLAELSRAGGIVFARGTGVSFWQLLWRHGWPALAGLLVWLAVWLWRAMPRFGPVDDGGRPGESRDTRRHLEAVGGYCWRHDRGHGLLEGLRQDVAARLQRRRVAAGGGGDDLFALAAVVSGLPVERVREAMLATDRPDPVTFTRRASDLQKLLKSL